MDDHQAGVLVPMEVEEWHDVQSSAFDACGDPRDQDIVWSLEVSGSIPWRGVWVPPADTGVVARRREVLIEELQPCFSNFSSISGIVNFASWHSSKVYSREKKSTSRLGRDALKHVLATQVWTVCFPFFLLWGSFVFKLAFLDGI